MDLFLKEAMDTSVLDKESKQAVLELAENTADPQAAIHNIMDFVKNSPELLPRLVQCLTDSLVLN